MMFCKVLAIFAFCALTVAFPSLDIGMYTLSPLEEGVAVCVYGGNWCEEGLISGESFK